MQNAGVEDLIGVRNVVGNQGPHGVSDGIEEDGVGNLAREVLTHRFGAGFQGCVDRVHHQVRAFVEPLLQAIDALVLRIQAGHRDQRSLSLMASICSHVPAGRSFQGLW